MRTLKMLQSQISFCLVTILCCSGICRAHDFSDWSDVEDRAGWAREQLHLSGKNREGSKEAAPSRVFFSPNGKCAEALIAEINRATKSLDIAIYSVNHPEVTTAILEAGKRGVAIRLVCDKTESGGKNSATKTFQKANLPIHIQHGSGGGIMHIKMCIVDGAVVTLGSFNYTTRASAMNDEVEVILTGSDIVSQCQKKFEDLWAKR